MPKRFIKGGAGGFSAMSLVWFALVMSCVVTMPSCLPASQEGDTVGNEPQEDVSFNSYIWISPEELSTLPMSGKAWDNLLEYAHKSTVAPDLSNQNDMVNVCVLAKALVFARTGEAHYRDEVVATCMAAIGTEDGGRTLALGRELIAYVLAADLVRMPQSENEIFEKWLRACLTKRLSGRTLVSTHEDRPNNWGTHAGASRVAVAAYLRDAQELERCARVLRGYLGKRDRYTGFKYGDLSWQADPKHPVGINPKGSKKGAFSIDGVIPDDQRRGGSFSWPPPKENYVYEALQGVLSQAVILDRAGYDVWSWGDKAILRSYDWLHSEAGFPAEGDDAWQSSIINYYYGRDFPVVIPSKPGKGVGFADWTHAGVRSH